MSRIGSSVDQNSFILFFLLAFLNLHLSLFILISSSKSTQTFDTNTYGDTNIHNSSMYAHVILILKLFLQICLPFISLLHSWINRTFTDRTWGINCILLWRKHEKQTSLSKGFKVILPEMMSKQKVRKREGNWVSLIKLAFAW